MKLTLTREQIPLARETVAWLRRGGKEPAPRGVCSVPGYEEWMQDHAAGCDFRWVDALEAAITEAEAPMQTITLARLGDADERAFWREAYAWSRQFSHAPGRSPSLVASDAADEADEALARYRKAFCAGMPSDQKGVER